MFSNLILKSAYWLKWVCLCFFFISLFMVKINLPAFFVSVALFLLTGSALLVNKIPGDKVFLRALVFILLLAFALPFSINIINGISDGFLNTITGNAVDESAYSFQRNYREVGKIPGCIKAMLMRDDVRQMNSTFIFHHLILGLGIFVVSLFVAFRDVPKAIAAMNAGSGAKFLFIGAWLSLLVWGCGFLFTHQFLWPVGCAQLLMGKL